MKHRAKRVKKYFRKKSGKEDLKVSELIKEDIDKALLRAQLLLSLEDEVVSKPLIIKAANTDNPDIKFRVTKNTEPSKVEYTESILTTLYLGKTSLFFHEAIVNHINGYVLEDYASEVKYHDIVHVETYLDYDPRVNNIGVSSLYLILHLINGTSITLNLRSHYMYNRKEHSELITNDERQVITNIQKAIRAVK